MADEGFSQPLKRFSHLFERATNFFRTEEHKRLNGQAKFTYGYEVKPFERLVLTVLFRIA